MKKYYPEDYPKVVQYYYVQINMGDGNMGESVNYIKGNVDNKGVISAGDQNVNTVNINEQKIEEFCKLTEEVLHSIDRLDIESNKKEQLKECVQSIAEEVSRKEPRKSIIDMMLRGLDTIIKPTELGPALEKWISWITNMIGG